MIRDRWCGYFLHQSSGAAQPAATAAERNCKISKTGFSALNFSQYGISWYQSFRTPAVKQPDRAWSDGRVFRRRVERDSAVQRHTHTRRDRLTDGWTE